MRQHRLQPASARPNESSFFTTPRSRARTSPNVSLSDIPFLQLSNSSPTINSNFEYENRFVGSRAYRACAVSSRKSKEEEEEKEKNVAD